MTRNEAKSHAWQKRQKLGVAFQNKYGLGHSSYRANTCLIKAHILVGRHHKYDIWDWCIKHDIEYYVNKPVMYPSKYMMKIRFKHAADAIRFKLTWSGHSELG